MKRLATVFLIALMCNSVHAVVTGEKVLKAMQDYAEGNTSSALRRLSVIVEAEPDNYQARWRLLRYSILDLDEKDTSRFRSVHKEVQDISALAIKAGDQAYAHFVQSFYARNHRAYETAMLELDRAIALEPKSVLYVSVKAGLLIRVGIWKRDNELIREGIEYYEKAHLLAGDERPPYFTAADYHFQVAWALGQLTDGENCPAEAIDHYLAVARLSPVANRKVAFAWNNVSCAYRKIGECEKAKEASEKALEIRKFGAAKTNLQYSEFCIEMQKSGLWVKADP